MILLPLVSSFCFILLFLIFYLNLGKIRESLLGSSIIFGVILTFIIELLSLFKAVNLSGIFISWLMVDGFLILIYQKTKKRSKKNILHPLRSIQWSNKPFNFNFALGIALGIFALIIGLVAIVAAPNHSDSMEYHLSRIVHWMQNQSIAHYPTSDLFQLYQPPWAEFAIMNFQILSGGDYFAALVQWFSMVGSWLGVSLIARRLGASQKGQVIAAIIAATVPMGILQGSSTDNNYVVTFWLVCFAYYTLSIFQEGMSKMNILLLGSSLGLAILTKGTAYIYAFPFAIWLGIWGIKHLRWKVWQPIVIVLGIVFLINGGHYLRNLALFGSPLGLAADKETLEKFSLSILIISSLKQLSLHADIIRYFHLENFITPLTGIVNKIIELVHTFLGFDLKSPLFNSPKAPKFYVPSLSTYEDTAGNPFHLILIAVALFLFLINKKFWKQPYLLGYIAVVLGGIFLFFALFTWSPYRCRLHLPFFILSSSFAGIVFAQSLNYKITNILAIMLVLLSYPWLFFNTTRPLIGDNSILVEPRIEHYFATQKRFQSPYFNLADQLQSYTCSNIGLIMRGTSFEYPLWILLNNSRKSHIIHHVDINNESAQLIENSLQREFQPCIIVRSMRFGSQKESENSLTYNQKTYLQEWVENWGGDSGEVKIFMLQDSQ